MKSKNLGVFILPVTCRKLTKRAAENYFDNYLNTVPIIKNIVSTVETSLKAKPGWRDFNIPASVDFSDPYAIGDLKLIVKTIPTIKKPSYEDIYRGIWNILFFLNKRLHNGWRIDGIRKVKDRKEYKAYIRPELLLEIITEQRDKVKEKGIKQEIIKRTKKGLEYYFEGVKAPKILRIPLDVDYAELPDEAAILPEARVFYEEANNRAIKNFRKLIKEGVLGKNELQKREGKWKKIGEYLFHVWNTPSTKTSYVSIYNILVKDSNKEKITKSAGEIVLLAQEEERLEQKILDFYDIRNIKNRRYVSLEGFSKRLVEIYRANTKETISQKLETFPLIWKVK